MAFGLLATSATLALLTAQPLLRVGMETRHPPWAYIPDENPDPRGTPSHTTAQLRRLAGLDVDVMNALGRRLGVVLRVVPTAWADLETGLLERRFDLILSAWTRGPYTPESIVSSLPYCDWGLLVVVRAKDQRIRSHADLDGLRVGHLRDPAVERALWSIGHERFQVRELQEEMFRDLEAGALDAVIYDSLHVRWRAARDGKLRIVGEQLNRLGYHVGLRREDTVLFEKVQAALKDLIASGEMSQIRGRWEGKQASPSP